MVPDTLTYIVSIVGNTGDTMTCSWTGSNSRANRERRQSDPVETCGTVIRQLCCRDSYASNTGAATNTLAVQFNHLSVGPSAPDDGIAGVLGLGFCIPKPCSFISTRSMQDNRRRSRDPDSIQPARIGAKDLKIPSNLSLLPLPPRAPELNPQENIWQFMRQNWLSNQIFKSFDDIVDHCCYAWNTLIDQPWKIMSIARRD